MVNALLAGMRRKYKSWKLPAQIVVCFNTNGSLRTRLDMPVLGRHQVKVTTKVRVPGTVDEIVKEVNEALPDFLKHVYRIQHQYNYTKQLTENLKCNECLIHVDFSETVCANSAVYCISAASISAHGCYEGFRYPSIIRFLREYHNTDISERTLRRRSLDYGLRRRLQPSSLTDIYNAIRIQLQGPGIACRIVCSV